jgi:DHA1 family tetracycline resistance protein-like MFS transporter
MSVWKGSVRFSFFILCFGAFLDWMSYGLIYPQFAAFIFHSNPIFLATASDTLRGFFLGVLIAASPLGQFFASPFIGMLSDHIGRKRTLQLAYVIIIVGYFFSALGIWVGSLFLLVFGRVVTGVGAGNLPVINSAVADLSQPHEKAKNFALVAMGSGIGFTVGPFIGGKLSTWGFDVPFLFAGFLTMIALFLFSFLFDDIRPKQAKSLTSFRSRLHLFVYQTSFAKFRILFPAFFIFCFGWSYYWEFIPVTWIKIYKLNVSYIGNFYAYGSAFYVLSSGLLIRPLVKKFKSGSILIGAWLALGLCFSFLLFQKIELYWALIPVQQFLVALIFPVGTAIVSNAVSEHRQGEALGIFQSLQSFAIIYNFWEKLLSLISQYLEYSLF